MVQLERVEAVIEWRWSFEGENKKEESRNKEKGSKDNLGES